MSKTRADQLKAELVEDISERIAFIRGHAEDRVGVIWALKLIAEKVRELDEIDRLEGLLPIQIRPPVMLTHDEAALAAQLLRTCKTVKERQTGDKLTALMKKLDLYFEGRNRTGSSRHG